jgi:hypothetical protein
MRLVLYVRIRTLINVPSLGSHSHWQELSIYSSDVEEKESALNFVGGLWNVTGEARLFAALTSAVTFWLPRRTPGSDVPRQIANVTGMRNGNVRKLLFSMLNDQKVRKCGRRQYVLAGSDVPDTALVGPR